MIIRGIPPGSTLWLTGDGPFAVGGEPGFNITLPMLARLAGVGDNDLERTAGRDRFCWLDIDVGEASRNLFRRRTIDSDFVGVQDQVEIERVELLCSPRTDCRGSDNRLSLGIKVDHGLVLGHLVAAVAGLWVVRIAETRFASSGVAIWRGWRRDAGWTLPQPGDRPGHAEGRGQHGDQDHRHDHREDVRDPMRSLHCWLRSDRLRRRRRLRRSWLGRRG